MRTEIFAALGLLGGIWGSCAGDDSPCVIQKIGEPVAGLQMQAEVFPKEIRLGDTVYFGVMLQNVTGKEVTLGRDRTGRQFTVDGAPAWDVALGQVLRCRTFRDIWYDFFNNNLRTPVRDSVYGANWVECERVSVSQDGPKSPEIQSYRNWLEFFPFDQTLHGDGEPWLRRKEYRFSPEGKIGLIVDSAEFPPLEDWNHPFWRNVREEMAPDGVEIKICVRFPHPWDPEREIPIQTTIRVKPRPEREMEQIANWLASAPAEFFPKVEQGTKTWLQDFRTDSSGVVRRVLAVSQDVPASAERCTEICGQPYAPWQFMRVGNRKPFGDGIPRNVSAWHELERSWTSGTMRDEMRMTRHLLEYLEQMSSPDVPLTRERFGAAISGLEQWLDTLPVVQRLVFLATIPSRFRASPELSPEQAKRLSRIRSLLRLHFEKPNVWCQEETLREKGKYYFGTQL